MQVYALDEKGPLLATSADKGKNYYCPQCQGLVRLRKGDQRQPHFFHLKLTSSCRLAQKGLPHLQLQFMIKNLFASAEMEVPFPSIGRIADVADTESKTIFEIQYSPMSLEEAQGRCADYESLGFKIVWILHDDTFNQKKVTAAEKFLRTKTCYFSNLNVEGKGIIYDQHEELRGRWRRAKGIPLPIDLSAMQPVQNSTLKHRIGWMLYCPGDLIDLSQKGKFALSKRTVKPLHWLKEAYLAWLYTLLAKNSK